MNQQRKTGDPDCTEGARRRRGRGRDERFQNAANGQNVVGQSIGVRIKSKASGRDVVQLET